MPITNERNGPNCASTGSAHEELVGVKHSSTFAAAAQVRIAGVLFAERLSMITWMGSVSGRAALIDFNAARVFLPPLCRRVTPHNRSWETS